MKNQSQNSDANQSAVSGVADFLWKRKLWWIIPLILTLALLILVVIMALTSETKPFVYPSF